MNQESQEEYLRKLGSRNVCDGIQREPRIYYDQFAFPSPVLDGSTLQFGNPDAFRNGEQYPVQITHILAQMRRGEGESAVQGDERFIQRLGLRIRGNDTFYMNPQHIVIPGWHNVNSSASPVLTQGSATWDFEHAFPLGQRDTLVVDVAMIDPLFASPPEAARPVSVMFTGIGRASRRPYQLADIVALDAATSSAQLNVDSFRNDGAEVIDITQMTIFAGSPIDSDDPSGDIRQIAINVRQTGNGTNKDWGITPPGTVLPNTNRLIPAGLWGPSVGRAVISRVTGDGWLWQPGQGLNPEILQFVGFSDNEAVDLAMSGYIIVT